MSKLLNCVIEIYEMFSSNTKPTKPIIVNLNIGDQLTSISCGHVVVELIKFIAYQRLQIPYSYQWLKQVVNKRKTCEEENRNENLQSERQFRIASASLENLDFILKVRTLETINVMFIFLPYALGWGTLSVVPFLTLPLKVPLFLAPMTDYDLFGAPVIPWHQRRCAFLRAFLIVSLRNASITISVEILADKCSKVKKIIS